MYSQGGVVLKEIQNMRLIYKIAHTYPSQHFQDLVQEGYIGLMYAEAHFDSSKGVKFSTYAYVCIRSHMLNYYNRKVLNKPIYKNEALFTQSHTDTYIFEILDGLDDTEMNIVNMMIEGYTQDEIATMLRCSVKQARTKIYKIRKKISLNI